MAFSNMTKYKVIVIVGFFSTIILLSFYTTIILTLTSFIEKYISQDHYIEPE